MPLSEAELEFIAGTGRVAAGLSGAAAAIANGDRAGLAAALGANAGTLASGPSQHPGGDHPCTV